MYKNPSKSDIKSADLSVKAEVQRVKVTVLFRFLNRIKVQHCNFFVPFLTKTIINILCITLLCV